MPNSIKNFTERRLHTTFLDEYFKEKLASAEYGYMIYQPSSSVTKITLKVGRVGLAIGRRGKTIKELSISAKRILGHDRIQIEVEPLDDPESYPQVMAQRLASSLERGRHFRRSAYGTMRRIMGTGALGEGFVAKTGEPAEKFVKIGRAYAKIKRGTLGISVYIMIPEARLPDAIEIIAEPTHTSREIIRESDEELTEDLYTEGEEVDAPIEDEFGDLEELDATEDEIPKDAVKALNEDEELEELEDVE
ncbi:MAG: KH domain-containing protein [Candidatus Kariarchaeaceae archaeon]|jgi:small subunit ribosomal protein S3